jgi:signal transduction histidine kinase
MVVQAEAGTVLAGDPAKAVEAFDSISAAGREAVAQLDRALGVLRGDSPSRHPPRGLHDVPELVEQARSAGPAIALAVRGVPRPVSADLGAAIYRIIQEALTNTIKHAHASSVGVELEWRAASLLVSVIDDGVGARDDAGGRGLAGMAERVHAFGGVLDTASPGRGFRVTASLPLAPADD